MFQGAKLVHYKQLTLENSSFFVAGIPDGRSNETLAYFDEEANEKHYWSQYPTNDNATYATQYKIWGEFITFTTHLSNHMKLLECNIHGRDCGNATAHSRGRFEDINIMQCPFQFRCFTPEAAAGSPGCHRSFPFDFELNSSINAGK